jgi:hypothetical protein
MLVTSVDRLPARLMERKVKMVNAMRAKDGDPPVSVEEYKKQLRAEYEAMSLR